MRYPDITVNTHWWSHCTHHDLEAHTSTSALLPETLKAQDPRASASLLSRPPGSPRPKGRWSCQTGDGWDEGWKESRAHGGGIVWMDLYWQHSRLASGADKGRRLVGGPGQGEPASQLKKAVRPPTAEALTRGGQSGENVDLFTSASTAQALKSRPWKRTQQTASHVRGHKTFSSTTGDKRLTIETAGLDYTTELCILKQNQHVNMVIKVLFLLCIRLANRWEPGTTDMWGTGGNGEGIHTCVFILFFVLFTCPDTLTCGG